MDEFHQDTKFPKEGPLVEKWLEALGKNPNGWKWTKNTVVCSRHFNKNDFHKRGVRTAINPTAIPSVNLDLNTDARIAEYKNAKSPPSTDDESVASNRSELSASSNEDSDSSETKKRVSQFIQTMHSYSVTPKILEEQNAQLKGRLAYYRHALSKAKKQIQELKDEVGSLKSALGCVNIEQFVPEHQEENEQSLQMSDDLKWWNVSSCN